MSTAKERYYSLIEDFEIGVLQEIIDYVAELEQELAKLRESQTQKSIIKLCERVDKAEQQVEELKKENESLGVTELIIDAVNIDGAHHKQWYLEQIAVKLGIELPEHEKGIIP